MAKKEQSDWLDNSKLRKPLYEFNQAIKQVYTDYRYINKMVIPLCMDSIKNQTLFKRSLFYWSGKEWDFLTDCAVDPESLNKALNTKGYDYHKEDGNHYLTSQKTGDEYLVSTDLTKEQINDSGSYLGITALKNIHDSRKLINTYVLTQEDIEELLKYKSLERVIAVDNDVEVKMIMLKEIFPMIKKTNNIKIDVYGMVLEHVNDIVIHSCSENWVFTSAHCLITY